MRPDSESRCTAPAISGTATTWGTARVGTPAATAERTPVGESSMATQSSGDTPSSRAAARYGSGCGLPCETSSPVTTAAKVPSGSAPTTASASDRHDIVTSALGTPSSRSAESSSRAPGRHGTCSVTRLITRASSSSTIRSGSHGTAELSLMNVADTSRSLPTSWWANSSLHVPPCSSTISCSAAIQ